MKAKLIISIITNLILLHNCTFSQQVISISSNTKAYKCILDYIESFNNKNNEKLSTFFNSYYESPDLGRRLELENSLRKSWGKLKQYRVIYDTENEVILLLQASKMPQSYLLFNIKLNDKTPDKIEFFTRTGIPKPEGSTTLLTDEQAMYFADRSVPVEERIIQQTVHETANAFDTYYYIPGIGKRISAMLIENLNSRKYFHLTKAGRLADSITEDVHKLYFDSHSWIEANRRLLPYDSVAGPSQNYGFESVKILMGNIGYIKFNEFSPLKEAQEIASRALDTLSDCKSLIFDLRDNYGGYPEMTQFLSSYFFSIPIKINTLYDRNGNIVNEIWTLDSIPGKRFSDTFPVIILTSEQTASAAEGFVSFFKKTKRAMIIGEPTNGAYHPAKEIVINSLFVVSVPFLRGEAIDLREGDGIPPDITVSSEIALEKALEYLRNQ